DECGRLCHRHLDGYHFFEIVCHAFGKSHGSGFDESFLPFLIFGLWEFAAFFFDLWGDCVSKCLADTTESIAGSFRAAVAKNSAKNAGLSLDGTFRRIGLSLLTSRVLAVLFYPGVYHRLYFRH